MFDEFARECDAVLRSSIPAPLAATIRRLLEAGEPPAKVLDACRKAGATQDTFTGLPVEAEIEAVAAEIQATRN
ncbi:MAG TPA: hypothetical protein VMG10_13020 [Gemmataceae bacterium]|nr:hypothetical protein [Gemmataceae bacterium]